MHVLPQEIEVWYIIPAIRREMAVCFSHDHDLSYNDIALLMDITKAAVSMYLAGKRVKMIKMHPKAQEEVKNACQMIVTNKSTATKEIARVLEIIKKKKLHCELCGKMIGGELHDCQEIKIPESLL